ncbi:MAG: SBBP repeat-containing protein, partial [Chloroflexota bacterium]
MWIHPCTWAGLALVLAAALVPATAGTAAAGVSRAWTHQFGGAGADQAAGVAVDSDRNVYVTGR